MQGNGDYNAWGSQHNSAGTQSRKGGMQQQQQYDGYYREQQGMYPPGQDSIKVT